MKTRWLVRAQGQSDIFAQLLESRSLTEEDLSPHYYSLYNPHLLKDCDKLVNLIKVVQKNGSKVTIFGDYDADGVPAAVLLKEVLEWIGVESKIIIPNRDDGYGLNEQVVRQAALSSSLLITVDNGITAHKEISLAKQLGLKVAIIDHHLPLESLPSADAIVDPYQDNCHYPFKGLSACGLAFKIAQALVENDGEKMANRLKWLLDLVAISTVADMMSITGENRILVHWGLVVLRKTKRPGLKAIIQTASLSSEKINEYALGFIFGPRLNAAGRLNDNNLACDLLMASSMEKALNLAEKLETLNYKRVKLVEQVTNHARQMFEELLRKENTPIIVLSHHSWPSGVIGLVAGNLSTVFNRPAIIGAVEKGAVKASARSIESYNIVEALGRVKNELVRFGGHRQAAGLTVEKDRWDNFVSAITKDARKNINEGDLIKTITADTLLNFDQINQQFIEKLERLRPFGIGNLQPLFLLEKLTIKSIRPVGKNHLKLQLIQGEKQFDAIYFGGGNSEVDFRDQMIVDIMTKISLNHYNSRRSIVLEIVDLKKTPSLYEFING